MGISTASASTDRGRRSRGRTIPLSETNARCPPRGFVTAKFEVTAASNLAAGEILNFGSFEVTYVTSKLHGHFVPKYRI